MILILSIEEDSTTSKIIDWINHFGGTFLRINKTDLIENVKFKMDEVGHYNLTFDVQNKCYNSDMFTSFWYRRGDFNFLIDYPFYDDAELNSEVQKYLSDEVHEIRTLFHFVFQNKKSINSKYNSKLNKLSTLCLAQKHGLTIPNTFLSNNGPSIKLFKNHFSEIITKAISDTFLYEVQNHGGAIYGCYTEEIEEEEIPSDSLFYSLVQNKIEKEFEVRSFFFENTFYSMAIFSQSDTMTKTDFRNYNSEKPNRTVPFDLPADISTKLTFLMKDLSLNSGSVDLIYTQKGDYIFLEVNPIGQFGMVSYPCNYNIESKIAKYLLP